MLLDDIGGDGDVGDGRANKKSLFIILRDDDAEDFFWRGEVMGRHEIYEVLGLTQY
jgi:hypothetical protein